MVNSKLKVLIVDAQEHYLSFQKCILTEVGLQVETTQDPTKVIGLIKEYDPDLLILDKMLEIDGLVIAEEVKKEFDCLPVLIISATDYESDKRKAFALGCVDYVRKDISNEEFLARIKEYCYVGHLVKNLSETSEALGKFIERADRRSPNRAPDVQIAS